MGLFRSVQYRMIFVVLLWASALGLSVVEFSCLPQLPSWRFVFHLVVLLRLGPCSCLFCARHAFVSHQVLCLVACIQAYPLALEATLSLPQFSPLFCPCLVRFTQASEPWRWHACGFLTYVLSTASLVSWGGRMKTIPTTTFLPIFLRSSTIAVAALLFWPLSSLQVELYFFVHDYDVCMQNSVTRYVERQIIITSCRSTSFLVDFVIKMLFLLFVVFWPIKYNKNVHIGQKL